MSAYVFNYTPNKEGQIRIDGKYTNYDNVPTVSAAALHPV